MLAGKSSITLNATAVPVVNLAPSPVVLLNAGVAVTMATKLAHVVLACGASNSPVDTRCNVLHLVTGGACRRVNTAVVRAKWI